MAHLVYSRQCFISMVNPLAVMNLNSWPARKSRGKKKHVFIKKKNWIVQNRWNSSNFITISRSKEIKKRKETKMKRQDLTLNLSRAGSADVTDSGGQLYLSRTGQRCRKLPIPIYSRFSSVLSPVYDSTTSNQVINVIRFVFVVWSFPVIDRSKHSRYLFFFCQSLDSIESQSINRTLGHLLRFYFYNRVFA